MAAIACPHALHGVHTLYLAVAWLAAAYSMFTARVRRVRLGRVPPAPCPEHVWLLLRGRRDDDRRCAPHDLHALARLCVVLHNKPGTLSEMAGIFGFHNANILNLRLSHRDGPFHTFDVDLEVHNVHHLMRILSALRASEAVAQAERS